MRRHRSVRRVPSDEVLVLCDIGAMKLERDLKNPPAPNEKLVALFRGRGER
jgi:hypothetical protein